ncbi:hypothetical protein TRFO_26730 [Tritrichomonas foetus]|uniref:non-specific serine/threonine protein kinase n=1 Tax=Tritrichomonas foetus TaxID=1144522 RepID=A0A1J4K3H0_9EUKA|nr:hypothetical protein TRFO_26730 [Tritrichomonas foetus]|eukprot:OHT05522.1 hypothetical protein TRFO_26730 [Tritrichomonas foetus]
MLAILITFEKVYTSHNKSKMTNPPTPETNPEFQLPIFLFRSIDDYEQVDPFDDAFLEYPNIRYLRKVNFSESDDDENFFILKFIDFDQLNSQNDQKTDNEKLKTDVINFFNEAAIQATIPHPNLLKIEGIVLLNNENKLRPGIITKYCQNQTLATLIEMKPPESTNSGNDDSCNDDSCDDDSCNDDDFPRFHMPLNTFDDLRETYYSLVITDVIKMIHEREIIHGDIKPQNILIDARRNGFEPLVADFGNARFLKDGKAYISYGTKYYIAPEVMAGESPSKASDIFAFGILLYQMSQGVHSMNIKAESSGNSGDDNENVLNFYDEIITELSQPDDEAPIKSLIVQCIDKNAKNRPTAEEIINRILDEKKYLFFSLNVDADLILLFMQQMEKKKEELQNEYQQILESSNGSFSHIDAYGFYSLILCLLRLIKEESIHDPGASVLLQNYHTLKQETGLALLNVMNNYFTQNEDIDTLIFQFSLPLPLNLRQMNQIKAAPKAIGLKSTGNSVKQIMPIMPPKPIMKPLKIGPYLITNDTTTVGTKTVTIQHHVRTPFKKIIFRKSGMKLSFVI